MTGTIETIQHVREGIDALIRTEPRFAPLFQATGMPPLRRLPGGYPGLLRIITEQQLSLASAKAIWSRMVERYGPLEPENMLTLSDDDFRAVGQSAAKIKTIRHLSRALMERRLDLGALDAASDEDLRAALTMVPGIGPWTAEVYLLACLGRRDAWPAGDLALQVAAAAAFGTDRRPDARAMNALAEPWRPWRAVAARLIWAYYPIFEATADPGDPAAMTIDGPRLEPISAAPARQLVILLHGYGSDGDDLIELGRQWQTALPDAAFVSPHAPEACEPSPVGYQWFALPRLHPDEYWAGVQRAAPMLDAFIDAELERYQLDESKLALVGFSQGTMMALHVGLRRERVLAGILGYSGALAGAEALAAEIRSRPPVLLIHGDRDDLIPVQALELAAQALRGAQVPVETHISRGVGHSIGSDGLDLGTAFLRALLG